MSRTLAALINLYWAVWIDHLMPPDNPIVAEARDAILEATKASVEAIKTPAAPPGAHPKAANRKCGCKATAPSGEKCRRKEGHPGPHKHFSSGNRGMGFKSLEWE